MLVAATRDEFCHNVAEYVCNLCLASSGPKFTVALSGGSLPSILAEQLKQEPYRSRIDWTKWEVWFVDERYVGPDDKDSNFKECTTHLFSHVPISSSQIQQINSGLPLEECAQDYAKRLTQSLGPNPSLDLVLLGMGPDGHMASLFPGHPLLKEKDLIIASISDSPKPPPQRLTFTLPVINNAKHVAFVAGGAAKKEVLAEIFNGPSELPSALVKPTSGNLRWFVDQEAAQLVNVGNAPKM